MTPNRLDRIERDYEVSQLTTEATGIQVYDATERLLNVAVPELIAEVKRLTARNARLQRDSDWLACLEAAGVDNWEGYDAAHAIAEGADPRD